MLNGVRHALVFGALQKPFWVALLLSTANRSQYYHWSKWLLVKCLVMRETEIMVLQGVVIGLLLKNKMFLLRVSIVSLQQYKTVSI